MSSSNWVAIVSVVATSLATGYSTYSNNKSNTDLENTKQEHMLSVEKLKQDNLIALENVKSTREQNTFLQTKTLEVRTQYCNEAKSLYKELGDSVINSQDSNYVVQSAAIGCVRIFCLLRIGVGNSVIKICICLYRKLRYELRCGGLNHIVAIL